MAFFLIPPPPLPSSTQGEVPGEQGPHLLCWMLCPQCATLSSAHGKCSVNCESTNKWERWEECSPDGDPGEVGEGSIFASFIWCFSSVLFILPNNRLFLKFHVTGHVKCKVIPGSRCSVMTLCSHPACISHLCPPGGTGTPTASRKEQCQLFPE